VSLTKQGFFSNVIRFEIMLALHEVYNLPSGQITERQEQLIQSVSERLFKVFGDKMTVKELQERLEKVW